jgi:hypothetical protein
VRLHTRLPAEIHFEIQNFMLPYALSVMPVPRPKNQHREVGSVSGDRWERFDRLQRNLRPFLCRRPKRPPIERFHSYADLEDGRSDTTT